MSKNGKAPAVEAGALLEMVEDALLVGSIDAAAALARSTARGKPVYKKTRLRWRNQRRQVLLFDNALDALAELRKAVEAAQAASTAPSKPAQQMSLPLAANNNSGNGAAHHA